MKFKLSILCSLCFLLFITPSRAQTPHDLTGLTNLPTVSLSAETFGVAIGTIAHDQGTSFSSALQGRFVLHTNFAIGAEAEFGNNNTTIEKLGAFLELRKPWDAYEIYALLGARKQWSPNNWQAFAGGGASWMPAASLSSSLGIFSKGCLCVEDRLIIDITSSGLKAQPKNEVCAFVRLSF